MFKKYKINNNNLNKGGAELHIIHHIQLMLIFQLDFWISPKDRIQEYS